jgi:hypothetical protein
MWVGSSGIGRPRLIAGVRRGLIVAALICVAGPIVQAWRSPALALADSSTEAKECPYKTNTAKLGPPLKPPVELTPTQQSAQKLVNFGTSRTYKVVKHLTFTSNKPLPASLKPEQINYEAVLSRTGNTLETAEFPEPTFGGAYISHDRRSISFSACLNPAGISPGKYVGFITVSGPEGLGSASINLTVNAKDGTLFIVSGIVALLGAFVLLVLKDAATAKTESSQWSAAFLVPISSPMWWGATVLTLAAAFGTLYNIYANDPAWGASGFAGLISLVGAATAAVGGHAIIMTLGSKK